MAASQAIERVRDGEHDVCVRHRQAFTLPSSEPLFFAAGLAFGAMAVAARVIDVTGAVAAITAFDVAT